MDNQELIQECYLKGENIFITGAGGTGKTYSIKKIYEHAKENGAIIAVTALTGVAAILLDCNATTIHSWAGIGISASTKSIDDIVRKVSRSKFYRHNWEITDILVIDEISMMSLKLFELLDKLGQTIKNNDKPFGGIQIILSGDFFQLPPIKETNFCFESPNFLKMFDNIIYLKKIYRQNDNIYKNILLKLREGQITKKGINLLNSRLINDSHLIDNNITHLVPTKNKANKINNEFLESIKEDKHFYKRNIKECKETLTRFQKNKLELMTYSEKEAEINFVKTSTLTEEILVLKKGAFVMCIANLNIEGGIVNGSQGVIVDFNEEDLPIVEFGSDRKGSIKKVLIGKKEWKSENVPGISIFQIPLILAWGITIHKAQGITLEKAIIDIGNDIFEAGQMYVALSRLISLNGLYLEHFDIKRLMINEKVINFYKLLSNL